MDITESLRHGISIVSLLVGFGVSESFDLTLVRGLKYKSIRGNRRSQFVLLPSISHLERKENQDAALIIAIFAFVSPETLTCRLKLHLASFIMDHVEILDYPAKHTISNPRSCDIPTFRNTN